MIRMRRLSLLAILASGFAAVAAPPKVTVLFTGDNGGEIAPCG